MLQVKAAKPTSLPSAPSRLDRQKLSQNAGFTLLEILVSIVIIAVGVLGATAMQSASLRGGVLARTLDSATNIASDALDRIQMNSANIGDYIGGNYANPFTVSLQDDQDDIPGNNSERPDTVDAGADYDTIYTQMRNMALDNATLSITFQADTPTVGVDTATATVSWPYLGGTKQCQIVHIITKK
ncbi:hypothetical protein MNBD_NITROSPINAE01-1192 [hydrothermal vent metagenome]|uniref:Type IV fimbrial biogenesis protein PilV n=1 Tax=hydrothermal vent metagenome TaxID=652676 RepID=A0A3B1CPE9_9ZZZZ